MVTKNQIKIVHSETILDALIGFESSYRTLFQINIVSVISATSKLGFQ